MDRSNLILTHAQRSGAIGKTISRVGADAQVAHADAGAALEHLELAEQIDERGDALISEIARLLFDSRRTPSAAERDSLVRAASEKLNQYVELDELEEAHWAGYARSRVVSARGAVLRVVQRTESVLTRRSEGSNDAA